MARNNTAAIDPQSACLALTDVYGGEPEKVAAIYITRNPDTLKHLDGVPLH